MSSFGLPEAVYRLLKRRLSALRAGDEGAKKTGDVRFG
jgi:hypothetical protein